MLVKALMVGILMQGFPLPPPIVLPSPTTIPSLTPEPTNEGIIFAPEVSDFLSTAVANVNALPDDISAPGGVAVLPGSDASIVFNYGKWMLSAAAAEELVGPTLSPFIVHFGVAISLVVILGGVYLTFTLVVTLVRGIIWLVQQAIKFIPFLG